MNRTPLLLLPGTLSDAEIWRAQIDALHGHADIRVADLTTQTSIAAMANDAMGMIPNGTFALAGFSLGGYVAFEVLRRAGARVRGLALVNTQARAESPESRQRREKMMALARRDFPRLVDALIQFMLPAARIGEATLVATIQSMMNRVGAAAFVRQSHAVMERADSRATLATIDCPTLVIGGVEDPVAPPELSEEMAAAIPGARMHLLPATGHMGPLERPDQVAHLMWTWLECGSRLTKNQGPPLPAVAVSGE
jgi:pimeloyl-ACP methyl ester carboxylesterase